jgi:glycosyltransferase involved in cell wall biosynthesis
MNKLVSVVIPTHKRPKMLVRAVKSVLNQSYQNIEIIIVDDASNDSTENIVLNLLNEYRNIKYLKNEKPMGACFTRNRGIKIASGEFITGLDDDDEFLYKRIEELLENYDDKFSFICSDIKVIKNNGFKITKSNKNIKFFDLLWENIVGPQIFIKKERLVNIGMFDESLSSAQDYDLWLRLIQKFGSAMKLNSPSYILHTEHDLPRITTSSKKRQGYFKVYLKYKKNMTNKQKIYNLIILKKISNKKIPFLWILVLFPTYHYFIYSLFLYIKSKIK